MISINIKNKSYNKPIFYDTLLNIEENQIIGIKGPSGSGKSTLLSIIGLLENFDGDYKINDVLVNKKNTEQIRIENFAYIFQEPLLIPYLTVYDNIQEPLKNLKIKVDKAKVIDIVNKLNISDLLDRYPTDLSGGEAERVSIARAFLTGRKYILADEPTGSLDPINAKIVFDIFKLLNQEYQVTIIIVTHSNDFDSYFNTIYHLNDCKIVNEHE